MNLKQLRNLERFDQRISWSIEKTFPTIQVLEQFGNLKQIRIVKPAAGSINCITKALKANKHIEYLDIVFDTTEKGETD